MPAAYAHYRFGQQALAALSPELQKTVKAHIRLYDAGLHGPDPLFYHSIFRRDEIGALASRYHRIPGGELFEGFCARLREAPAEGGAAFLFGLLTHYCLDSQCHPLIAQLDEAKTCGHSELETEFDRFLLELDGEPLPHTRDLGAHLRLKPEELERMARFFPPVTAAQLSRCIRNMTWATRILSGRGLLPRGILERIIPLAGETVRQQLMPRTPSPRAKAFDGELLRLYNRALERLPDLAKQLEEHLYRGAPLGEAFAPIMG